MRKACAEQIEMPGWEGEERLGHTQEGHAHSMAGAQVRSEDAVER